MNLRPLRLDEVSFTHYMGKSEVAMTAYWRGVVGSANDFLSQEEAFDSEEAFVASELYQGLKTRAFQDLQLALENRFKTVAPLIRGTEEIEQAIENLNELPSLWGAATSILLRLKRCKAGSKIWESYDKKHTDISNRASEMSSQIRIALMEIKRTLDENNGEPTPKPELKSRWKDSTRVWEVVDITVQAEEPYYHLKLISGWYSMSTRVVEDVWFRGKKSEFQPPQS
jgi:DNA repair ATPase RecN